MSETIIAAVLLLHEKSVDEVAAKLTVGEEHWVSQVGKHVSGALVLEFSQLPSGTTGAEHSLGLRLRSVASVPGG